MNKHEIESSIRMIEETLLTIKSSICSDDDVGIVDEIDNDNEDSVVVNDVECADDSFVESNVVATQEDFSPSKQVTGLVGIDASNLISMYFGFKSQSSNPVRAITILNKMSLNKRNKQNILYLASLIESGDIKRNFSTGGRIEEFLNARFIHKALPKKFADRWTFNESSPRLFKLLLDNAKILYSIGECVKGIENKQERFFRCEELWKEYVSSEISGDNTITANNDVVESYRELQQNEQRIVVCGKQFWPVTQFSFNQNPERTYALVWGAGTFLEQLIGLLLSKGDTIESVAVWLMQNSRSLRLMTKEGAAVFHSMVAAIKSHPELFKDNNKTILPVTTSAPEGY